MSDSIKIAVVNADGYGEIEKLAVSGNQLGYIETAKECVGDLRRNAYNMKWTIDGIYADGKLVGFAMHGRQKFGLLPYSRIWLDRFMIDARFQGKGYGRAALRLIIDRLYEEYGCSKIFLSVHEDNAAAIRLYESFGFKRTAFKDGHGERIMRLG